MFTDEMFAQRVMELREKKGVSQRDMSLSIGQGAAYINNIENNRNLPSMTGFFYICEYFGITPAQFFEDEIEAIIFSESGMEILTLHCKAIGPVGEFIFLTQPEAEAALEKMEGEEHE